MWWTQCLAIPLMWWTKYLADVVDKVPCNATNVVDTVPCKATDVVDTVPCNATDVADTVPCNATDVVDTVPCRCGGHSTVPCNATYVVDTTLQRHWCGGHSTLQCHWFNGHSTSPITCSDDSVTSLRVKHVVTSGMWGRLKLSHTKYLQLAACLKVKLKKWKLSGHEDILGHGGTAPCILNFFATWSYVGRFTGRPLEARRHCQDRCLEGGWVDPQRTWTSRLSDKER